MSHFLLSLITFSKKFTYATIETSSSVAGRISPDRSINLSSIRLDGHLRDDIVAVLGNSRCARVSTLALLFVFARERRWERACER